MSEHNVLNNQCDMKYTVHLPSTKPVHSKIFSILDPFIEHLFIVLVLLSDQYSLLPDTCTAKALE